MKKALFSLALAMGIAAAVKAQCNQGLQLSSSKTDLLNAAYQSQGIRSEKVVIDITTSTITITQNGNGAEALTGKIKDIKCAWKVPFKEGKTVIRTELADASGDIKDAAITIEGKNGKITVLAEAKERPDQKMRLEVDKFEAKEEIKQ